MNKKSKEIVKKLYFTLVVVISIISIIGCPNTVSSKANGTDNKEPNPPSPRITLTGGNHGNVKVRLNDGSWGALNEFRFDLLKKDDEITFRVEDPDAGYGLVLPEAFQWNKTKPNEATLKNSDNKYKNGINLSFKEVEGYLRFEEGDPVVTDYRGLSFGKKSKRLCLYGGITLIDAKNDIEEGSSVWDDYPTDEFYQDLKSGLRDRWFAARSTFCYGGSVKWLAKLDNSSIVSRMNDYLTGTLNISDSILKNKQVFKFDNVAQYFAVDKNVDIFVRTPSSGDSHFVDWHIVFVKKADSKMYSFHYGPYTLKNKKKNEDDPLIPGYKNDNVDNHVFTLAGMLLDSLRKNGVLFLGDIENFILIKSKDNYDIYLVIGKYYRGTTDNIFYGYNKVSRSFRNVFMLSGDAYTDHWTNCWTVDQSDQDGFPSLLPLPSP